MFSVLGCWSRGKANWRQLGHEIEFFWVVFGDSLPPVHIITPGMYWIFCNLWPVSDKLQISDHVLIRTELDVVTLKDFSCRLCRWICSSWVLHWGGKPKWRQLVSQERDFMMLFEMDCPSVDIITSGMYRSFSNLWPVRDNIIELIWFIFSM